MAIQDEFEVTIQFKHDMILFAQNNWPGIAGKLNEMFKPTPKLRDHIRPQCLLTHCLPDCRQKARLPELDQ